MKRSILVRRLAATIGLCAALTVACPPALWAKEPPPRVTVDGLELKKETSRRLVYVRSGATFSQYKRVAILNCHREFSQDWLHRYNESQRDSSRRIHESDIEWATADPAAQFKKIFTDELEAKGGYPVAGSAAADVLVLRPALINIKLGAPDLMAPGQSITFARSAGQVTLYIWSRGIPSRTPFWRACWMRRPTRTSPGRPGAESPLGPPSIGS